MRYHYEKPTIYLSMYGKRYICNHPVYDSCTLFEIGDKGLAVIQQRYDAETKSAENEAFAKAALGNGLRPP